MENDIIPLYFSDKNNQGSVVKNWIFDTRHTDPLSGNGMIEGSAPVENAMPLGNYGVVERYVIDITNQTDDDKTISYIMNTASHAIIRYKDGDNSWNTKIKLREIRTDETYEEFEQSALIQNIFSIDLAAGETKQLIIETILPNADDGGFKHQLKAENK